MKRVAAIAVVVVVFALRARAQSSITGRVVSDATGDPIANARVSLAGAAPGAPVVLSDADGRFALPPQPQPRSIVASKSGYARLEQPPPAAGTPLVIRLLKGAVVSGRVVDEFGDPVPAARVSLERSGDAARPGPPPPGPRVVAGGAAAAVTETDDRGEYRLASLPAGSFVVAVTTLGSTMIAVTIDGNQTAYGPDFYKSYYPGVEDPKEAQELALRAGDDRRSIDFVVPSSRSDNQPDSVMRFGGMMPPALARAGADRDARATGVLRGRVMSTDGRALPHAQVRALVVNGMPVPRTSRADGSGDFELQAVPAGRYRIVASRAGYAIDPTAEPVLVELGEGQTRDRLEVRLARWGTLEGRILDETGEPLQGASVQMLQVRYEAGRRRLVPAATAARITDDLGRYRLYGIAPGQYIVSAAVGAVQSADLPGYTRSYFPGTANPGQAQFVSVGLSQELIGVDLTMTRARTARIAGKTLNADGETSMPGSLNLIPSQRSASVTSVPVGARTLPDGTFEFPNVPPGQYVIQANRGRKGPSVEGEFGALAVTSDGVDVTNLVLQMSAGSSIRGRFTFDAADRSKTPARGDIELSPIPVDFDQTPQNNFARAEIADDWSFAIAGINGPRRLELLRAPPGWALKEIRVNGVDATDRPLAFGRPAQSLRDVEVVLTDRVSELAGTIADEHGSLVSGARLIVFATDRGRWYPASRFLRTATAAADGAFTVAGLPFGAYYAVALSGPLAGGDDAWQDPQLLESLVPRASSVTIREGERQTLSLQTPTR